MMEALSMPWQIRTGLIKQSAHNRAWQDNYRIPYLLL